MEHADDGLVGRLAGDALLATDVHGELRGVVQVGRQLNRFEALREHARTLQRHESLEAELVDVGQGRLDARPRVDGDGHQWEILREREQAVGAQMLLGAEALDAAHHDTCRQPVTGVDVGKGIRHEPAVGAVALAVVGRELQAVLAHSVAPS